MTNKALKKYLHVLPLDSESKIWIMENYDSLPPDKKSQMSDFILDSYEAYYNAKIKENFEKGLSTAKGKDYYNQVVKETSEQIQDELFEAAKVADLSEVRRSVKYIMKEIKASKQPKNSN